MKTIKSKIITLLLTAVAVITYTYNIFPCFIVPHEEATNLAGLIALSVFLLFIYEVASYNKTTIIISISVVAVILGVIYIRFYPTIIWALSNDINAVAPYMFLLLTIGITLFGFICSRSRVGTVLFFVVGVLTFFFQILTGFTIYLLAQIFFFIGAGSLYLYTAYAKNAKKYGSKNTWPIFFVTLSAALCILTVVGGEFLYNNSTVLSSIDTLSWDQIPKPIRDSLEISINMTGFSSYDPDRQLGGALWYNYSYVLDVKTGGPFYLRGRVYNQYTGKGWHIDDTNYDAKSNYSTYWLNTYFYAVNRDYFMSHYFKDPENAALNYDRNYDGGTTYQLMTISYRYPFSNIFLPLNNLMYVNGYEYGANLEVAKRMERGTTYGSISININTFSQRFQAVKDNYEAIYQDLKKDPKLTDVVKDMNAAQAEAVQDYCSVENISQQTIVLAKEITKDCKTDLEKIDAIKKYLTDGKNLTYNTATVPPPDNQDFVSNFLFVTKKGYCVHFASAGVAMLRAVGIPARYVDGFISPTLKDGDYYHIGNRDSHAWVEAYTPLTGFFTVEVTPGFERIPEGDFTPNSDSHTSESSSEQSISLNPYDSNVSTKGNGGNEIDWQSVALYSIIYTGITVAVLLMAICIKLLLRKLWIKRLSAKVRRSAVIKIYEHFLRDLKIMGLQRHFDETPYEYGMRIDAEMYFIQVGLRVDYYDVTLVAVKARYSDNKITDEEYAQVVKFYGNFFPSCRKHVGKWKYAIRFFLL